MTKDSEYIVGAIEELETALTALRKVHFLHEPCGLTKKQWLRLRYAIMAISGLETELGKKLWRMLDVTT